MKERSGIFQMLTAIALAGAAVLALAVWSLGDIGVAFHQEYKLSDPPAAGLVVEPGQEQVLKPPRLDLRGQTWEVRLTCQNEGGCAGLALKVDNRLLPPIRQDGKQIYFLPSIDSPAAPRLKLANRSGQRFVLSEVRWQNFRGINRRFPPLALLLTNPVQEITVQLGLVLACAILAQFVPLLLGIGRVGWGLASWRCWVLAGPSLAALGMAAVASLWNLYLVLPGETFLIVTGLGPTVMFCASFWDPEFRNRFLKWGIKWGILFLCFFLVAGLAYKIEKKRSTVPGLIGFLHLGNHFTKDRRFVPKVKLADKIGYDGQFFYYAAQDPFALKGAWQNMDSPSYRYQRMFYPLLVNLLYGGDKDRLPPIMLGVSLAAVVGTFVLIYLLAVRLGAPWPWTLFFFFFYGLFQPVYPGLCEPLANFLLVLSLYLLMSQRFSWAMISMSLMALTKEYYTLLPLFGAVAAWLKRQREKWWFAPPVLIAGAWQFFLFFHLGRFAFQESHRNVSWPLKEIFYQMYVTPSVRDVIFCLGVLATIALAVWLLWRSPRRWDLWLLAAFLIMPVMGGKAIWEHEASFVRTFSPTYLIYLIVLFRERSWIASLPGAFFACHVLFYLREL